MEISEKKKILLVDDEKDTLEFLSYNLKKEGYEVFTAQNGKIAIQEAIKNKPDLIILDVMMPQMDGIETCTELRKIQELDNSLITFLTARSEDYSQIAGFEAGADDYISKPVKPKVFVKKVNAMLKRSKNEPETQNNEINDNLIQFGDICINTEKHIVKYKDSEIQLPRKEFSLLLLLVSKPGKVFTRDEIYSKVWGDETIVGERTIDVHIRKLRTKIPNDSIKTLKGIGYKFSPD